MYIQTSDTPNPNAVKFIPGIPISPVQQYYFTSHEEAQSSFLARKLLNLNGVSSVFFGKDFITIVKDEGADWIVVKSETITTIVDHFTSGLEVFEKSLQENMHKDDSHIDEDDQGVVPVTEIEKQIFAIIEERVRPAVAMDGGDIIYKGFEDGVVKLKLRGACSGCPSSKITLKNGIESLLKHYVPEVIEVVEE